MGVEQGRPSARIWILAAIELAAALLARLLIGGGGTEMAGERHTSDHSKMLTGIPAGC